MLGAIIGDIVGSAYEFNPTNDYDFEIFKDGSNFTDDTICTIAIADALLRGKDYGESLHEWCRRYMKPKGGFGGRFRKWVESDDPKPYRSYGNGAAMRVSPVAWAILNAGAGIPMAEDTASCTHNHPEGIKGAQTTYLAIHHAIEMNACREVRTSENIKRIILDPCVKFSGYNVNLKKEDVINKFDESCQGTVPVALWVIGQSVSFEDAIRKAVSLGADADTLGAIVGSIAEPLWGIPQWMYDKAMRYLTVEMRTVVKHFEEKYGCNILDLYEDSYDDERSKMNVMLLWKLGLGNMAKFFNGEDHMPSKNITPSTEIISKLQPMSDNVDDVIHIDYIPIVIPNGAINIIRKGHLPEAQEDHWLMYCTFDTIRYYRSWTGLCAYECKYRKLDNQNYIIESIAINKGLCEFGVIGTFSALLLLQYLLIAETGGNWHPAWDAFVNHRYSFEHIKEEASSDDLDISSKHPTDLLLKDMIRGCMIGGAIGDALGYQVKGLTWYEIEKKHGRLGNRRYDKNMLNIAKISEETQMSIYTAGSLLHFGTKCIFEGQSPVDAYKYVIKSYDEWCDNIMDYRHSSYTCWFDGMEYLSAHRDLGGSTIGMLLARHDKRKFTKHSWGTCGMTRTAPLALYHAALNARHPNTIGVMDGAAMAGHLAWLTHRHPLGWLPACALHFILTGILQGHGVPSSIKSAISFMEDLCDQRARVDMVGSEISNYDEYMDSQIKLLELMKLACQLGEDNVTKDVAFKKLGKGYQGAEALAIAIYCCIRYSEPRNIRTIYKDTGESTAKTTLGKRMFEEAMCCAVSHSGNTDATGTLVGQIMGVWVGYSAIPGYYRGDPYCKDPLFENRREENVLEGFHELMTLSEDLYNGCPFTHKVAPNLVTTQKEKIWYLRYVLVNKCDSSTVDYFWNQHLCR